MSCQIETYHINHWTEKHEYRKISQWVSLYCVLTTHHNPQFLISFIVITLLLLKTTSRNFLGWAVPSHSDEKPTLGKTHVVSEGRGWGAVFSCAVGKGHFTFRQQVLQHELNCVSLLWGGSDILTLLCGEDEGLGGSVRKWRSPALLSCTTKDNQLLILFLCGLWFYTLVQLLLKWHGQKCCVIQNEVSVVILLWGSSGGVSGSRGGQKGWRFEVVFDAISGCVTGTGYRKYWWNYHTYVVQ